MAYAAIPTLTGVIVKRVRSRVSRDGYRYCRHQWSDGTVGHLPAYMTAQEAESEADQYYRPSGAYFCPREEHAS